MYLTSGTLDTTPERQTGRKAQISNITAAKVQFSNIIAMAAATLNSPSDSRRCYPNMFGSESYVENDSGSHGWYPVRANYHDTLATFSEPIRVFCSLTNDGNAILREIDVAHPAAKNMIELSRTQDEECGDGTTSVIILGA